MDDQHQRLAETLADILDAIEARDRLPGPSRAAASEPQLLRMSDLDDRHDRAVDYQQDPVGTALRVGLKDFIVRMSKLLTLGEFSSIADRAIERGGDYQFRSTVVDKRADGIVFKGGGGWYA